MALPDRRLWAKKNLQACGSGPAELEGYFLVANKPQLGLK
jgi:hypothetical protein